MGLLGQLVDFRLLLLSGVTVELPADAFHFLVDRLAGPAGRPGPLWAMVESCGRSLRAVRCNASYWAVRRPSSLGSLSFIAAPSLFGGVATDDQMTNFANSHRKPSGGS
ncbi:hypothetical protein ACVIDN_006106 [Rhizobium brockwellii]